MKKKVGFYLPAALADAYEEVAQRVGEREKSQVIGAAIVMLLEASEERKNAYIRRVRDAGGPGRSYEKLVREAKARADDPPALPDGAEFARQRGGKVISPPLPPGGHASTTARRPARGAR